MRKANEASAKEKYNARFASTLRQFMADHPVTHERVTQKAIADILDVRPQTVAYYTNGESLPNNEVCVKLADFFGVTVDFLLTGRRIENKAAREMLGLSDNTLENMKLVKDGYFEDSQYMLAIIDYLLGDKDLYLSIEKAVKYLRKRDDAIDDDYREALENMAARRLQDYLLDVFSRDLPGIYKELGGQEK